MKTKFIVLAFLFLFQTASMSDWQKMVSYPNAFVTDILVSGGVVYVTSYSGVHRSTDGTLSWQLLNTGLNNAQAVQCKQIIISGSNMYAATVDGVYKTTNTGANWIKKSDGIFVGNGAIYAFAESIYEINGMLLTGAYTGIYKSTNGGDNWIATNITGMHIWAKNFTLYNNVLYAARESGNIPGSYKSTDNGITWSPYSITGLYLPAITFYNDGSRLYAGTIVGVWLTTNSGSSWVEKNVGLSADPYSSSIIRVNGVLVTSLKFGGSGVYKSTNNGDQWIDIKQGIPFVTEISKLMVFNNKIFAGTSEGIYQRDISELTGIKVISNEIPSQFSLSQNYPNPFNPGTKIRFAAPASGEPVQLVIYDILGKVVSVLIDRQIEPGSYEVTFDGSALPSGVYYYSLKASDFKDTKKMVLVK